MTCLLSYWKPLLCAIVIAIAASGGALIEHWRMESRLSAQADAFQSDLSTIKLAAAKAQQEANERRQALAKAIQQQSADQYREYTDAQHQNAQLRADLLTAQRRLSVRVSGCSAAAEVSTAAGAGSMDHAAGRAYLDPADSAALLGIVNRGDDAIRKLTACQGYVRKILGE